jgi:hypothetical protein
VTLFWAAGYDTTLKAMTFGKRPCVEFSDFICFATLFGTFFKDVMIANCSGECPLECSSMEYSIVQTFSKFPPAGYMYYLLGQSESLSQKYFNLSARSFQDALIYTKPELAPPMDVLQSKLESKLVSLNIFYDELGYTKIEESPKMSLIDLIAGMGGTLVTLFISNYPKLSI